VGFKSFSPMTPPPLWPSPALKPERAQRAPGGLHSLILGARSEYLAADKT
jgi:hypothetical protein